MSIQRIGASAVSSTVEANFALNHMNLDFSLVKVDAPAELRPLGNLLSKKRKSSAEDGPLHILARRLGALFGDVLPDVPSLLTAYGRRASEIAEATDKATRAPNAANFGPFSAHFGIDSTSIWAAATSSKSAIRIHLLACILARVWTPQEATAIWVDLILHRQAQIKRAVEDEGAAANAMAYAAALHKLGQSTIAEWDASARSWMEIADKAKSRQQKQIDLILDNISVPVKDLTRQEVERGSHASRTRETLYNNVISNANEALSTLNNLIEGMPQRISAGGILLALMSWHIYPDLVLLGQKPIHVYQDDNLVSCSGVATFNIAAMAEHPSNSSGSIFADPQPRVSGASNRPNKGVHWSLALSSLHYYGTVERSRSTLHDMRRVTIPQLQLLALGAILDRESLVSLPLYIQVLEFIRKSSIRLLEQRAPKLISELQWVMKGISTFSKEAEVFEYEKSMADDEIAISYERKKYREFNRKLSVPILKSLQLLSCFTSGIELLHSEDDQERRMAEKLVSYGARHGKQWMSNTGPDTIPRLIGLANVRAILGVLNQTQRILLLRKLYNLRNIDQRSVVIRYADKPGRWACVSVFPMEEHNPHTRKRKRDESDSEPEPGDREGCPDKIETPANENWVFLHDGNILTHRSVEPPNLSEGDMAIGDLFEDESFHSWIQDQPGETQTTVFYDFLFGDPTLAAIYSRRETSERKTTREKEWSYAPFDVVLGLLKDETIDMDSAADIILETLSARKAPRNSMLLLGKISQYYQDHLPEATVNVEVIKSSMVSWEWSQGFLSMTDAFSPLRLHNLDETFCYFNGLQTQEQKGSVKQVLFRKIGITRAQVFAMIFQLNSGNISLNGRSMENVMALSRGNSLYVAKRLVCDPTDVVSGQDYVVEHVMGNVGKPGIALMVTPRALNIRQHSIDEWHFSNHAKFDGERSVGAFDGTSLHLSFTGYEEPLQQVSGELSGLRGHDAIFLETLISVEDRGNWVADLDILQAFENDGRVQQFEKHDGSCGHRDPSFTCSDLNMTSIDCWEELIDPPDSIMVVRAGTSWMARVAAVSIASSKRYTCCYGPPEGDVCWQCFLEFAAGTKNDLSRLRNLKDIVIVY